MIRKHKTALIVTPILIIAVLICGTIGYLNDPRFAPKGLLQAHGTPSGAVSPLMKLNYCYSSAPSLCIVSFGKDQTGSSLIVLRNGNPAWKQLFLKVKQTDILQISVCQQVQFSNDVYYCTVPTLLEGTDVQIGVYVADTSLLVASGLIRVSFGATPGAKESETPASQYATATFQEPTQIFTPTPATRLSPTRVPTKARTPSYPNP